MSQAQAVVTRIERQPPPSAGMPDLVNGLTQELALARRTLATATQKLGLTARTLEARTQELTEARSALALLLATLDSTTDGVLAMGYFGRAMHYNTRFVEMWRVPADKLDQLNDAALLTIQLAQVKDPDRFLALMTQRKSEPETDLFSVIELTDGRIFECKIKPQRVQGKRVGTVTSFHDVTGCERMARLISVLETQSPLQVAQARESSY